MVGALFWCNGIRLLCATTKVPGPFVVVGGYAVGSPGVLAVCCGLRWALRQMIWIT